LLWTAGLGTAAFYMASILASSYPDAPRLVHDSFVHAVLLVGGATALMAGGIWYVRRGVSPIQQLRERLQAVRDAREETVGGEYPSEIQPVVDDMNALLGQRAEAVRRAIDRAGDLAHGLKTPLAVLTHEVERARASGHADLAARLDEELGRMRGQVDYHLAHARAAASGAAPGTRCDVRESAEALARALRRIHAERGVAVSVEVPDGLGVRVQREDLDEMLGNLLDNACKWARARVTLTSRAEADRVVIDVDDDGDGVPTEMREVVLRRGVRADEAAPGSGLGLAIVRDLAQVYGGSIALTDSPRGGLRARLDLPAA
jgi:signal transduction histidine kinase